MLHLADALHAVAHHEHVGRLDRPVGHQIAAAVLDRDEGESGGLHGLVERLVATGLDQPAGVPAADGVTGLGRIGVAPVGETLGSFAERVLAGLPPTIAEQEAFAKDPSATALDRVIHDLLNRPACQTPVFASLRADLA